MNLLGPARKDLRGFYPKMKQGKPVERLDLEGNVVYSYRSVHDARISTGLSYAGIRDCCRGKTQEYAGFRWRFVTTTLSGLSGEDNQRKE